VSAGRRKRNRSCLFLQYWGDALRIAKRGTPNSDRRVPEHIFVLVLRPGARITASISTAPNAGSWLVQTVFQVCARQKIIQRSGPRQIALRPARGACPPKGSHGTHARCSGPGLEISPGGHSGRLIRFRAWPTPAGTPPTAAHASEKKQQHNHHRQHFFRQQTPPGRRTARAHARGQFQARSAPANPAAINTPCGGRFKI